MPASGWGSRAGAQRPWREYRKLRGSAIRQRLGEFPAALSPEMPMVSRLFQDPATCRGLLLPWQHSCGSCQIIT